jgi:hypothetical protein
MRISEYSQLWQNRSPSGQNSGGLFSVISLCGKI